MADPFTDKVAIVTGGGSGIGEAMCRELAHRGARVIVADINSDGAKRVAEAIEASGGRAQAHTVDVSKEGDVKRLVDETAATHGSLDYMFNNAGIAIGGDARDLTLDQWRKVLDVNLYGVLYGALAAYQIMVSQGSGHIVNTSSASGLLPQPINAPYCTAKHGLVGFSRALRLEAADLGVNVSVVFPGYVQTAIYQNTVVVNLPEEATRPPVRPLPAAKAAQVILDGVARNQAAILFPAKMRLICRAYYHFPRLVDQVILRKVRKVRMQRITAADGAER
jgi:NAD(P)-dependent dehydrogenase (short-subunit alcohol dehydrogenase family)